MQIEQLGEQTVPIDGRWKDKRGDDESSLGEVDKLRNKVDRDRAL